MNEKYIKDRITIYDVAKSAKVSLATVSRVINGQTSVKESTRIRVEKTIENLGYKPSALAQSLASNRSASIAIIIPSSYNTYVSLILAGMLDVAKIYGYKSTVFTISQGANDYYEVMEMVIKSRVDGAIFYHPDLPIEALDHLEKFKIPIIQIGSEVKTGPKLGTVLLDLSSNLKKFLSEYEKKSNRKIIQLSAENNGYFDDEYIIPIDDTYNKTYNLFTQEFKNGNYQNCLIVAPRDSIASAVVNAALDNDLKLPDDLEVISMLDTKFSVRLRPKISSFAVDLYEVGSIGMRMLTKLLADKLTDKTYFFTSKYVKRQTTKI